MEKPKTERKKGKPRELGKSEVQSPTEVTTFEIPKTVFTVRGKEVTIPIEPSENRAIWDERVQFILLAGEKTKLKIEEIVELSRYYANKVFYGITYPQDIENQLSEVLSKAAVKKPKIKIVAA